MRLDKLKNNILQFISAPIAEYLYLLIPAVLLLCIPNFVYWTIERGYTTLGFSIIALEALTVYALLLPVKYLGKFRRVYVGIIALIFLVCTVVDVVCLEGMKAPFNKDFFSAIIHSNVSESTEFFETTFNYKMVIVFVVTLLITIGAYFALKSCRVRSGRKSAVATVCFLGICVVLVGMNPYALFYSCIQKVRFACIIQPVDDIDDLINNPEIEVRHEPAVNNLVLIIGESFNKDHSSLYGYQRNTNPRLQQLCDSGSLIVFDKVKSNAVYTELAYKNIFSTFDRDYTQSDWYTNPNIFEILNKGGVKTKWFSNQSKFGYFDGVGSQFSQLCDTALFTRDISQILKEETFDELIIPMLYAENVPTFDVIALLGMHENFDARYPSNRAVFSESEYTDYLPHQRQDMMNYDNTVVYNDSVINEIINFYADKESLIFYFPDHALDLYHTRADFCSHAITSDAASVEYCRQIPFVVYVSDSLAVKYPGLKDGLRSMADKDFNTTNIIYTIMDITGVRLKDDSKVDSLSIFKIR